MNIYFIVLCCFAGAGAAAAAAAAVEVAVPNAEVLPNDAIVSEDYDESVRTLSTAAQRRGLYLVLERHGSGGGAVVAVKAAGDVAKCSTPAAAGGPAPGARGPVADAGGLVTFSTDFAETFGLLEEDFVLARTRLLNGLTDFVLAGPWAWPSPIPYYSAAQNDVTYGLAAFDGVRQFGESQHIRARHCAVFACAGAAAGLYERTCAFGSANNSTNIALEKLVISANFSNDDSVFYPIMISDRDIPPERFQFASQSVVDVRTVKMTVTDAAGLRAFGRRFHRDYETLPRVEEGAHLYDYIFNDDVQEFFDFMWIRVRVVFIIVSIYILEML